MDVTHFCWIFLIFFAFHSVDCDLPYPFKEVCEKNLYPPTSGNVSTYVIDLDKAPELRWQQLIVDKRLMLKNLIDTLKSYLLDWSPYFKYIIKFMDDDLGMLVETLPEEYRRELEGIAKYSQLPLGDVVLYNIFYEIFTLCTSVVAEDSNGNIYHGRNLDFGLFMGWNATAHSWLITDALRPTIVNMNFIQNGTILYKGVGFAGFVGLLTATKPGVFGFTINERFDLKDGGYKGIFDWLEGDHSGNWLAFETRDLMRDSTSYDSAKSKLSSNILLAPAYFILSGNQSGQGCIITRTRNSTLNIKSLDLKNGIWYLVQDNYDNWVQPPFYDDRRSPCIKCMDSIKGKNVATGHIFDVLSSKPMLNKLTTYTSIMQINKGSVETYVQNCPDPCWPW